MPPRSPKQLNLNTALITIATALGVWYGQRTLAKIDEYGIAIATLNQEYISLRSDVDRHEHYIQRDSSFNNQPSVKIKP